MRKLKYDKQDHTELKLGVEWVTNMTQVTGWVSNIKSYSLYDENEKEHTSLLIYVMQQDGHFFKCQYQFAPYFFVAPDKDQVDEIMMQLENKFEKQLIKLEKVFKTDLEQINHLAGLKKTYIKLTFRTISDLVQVRNQLRNYELREYDVPYHCRVCIDTGIRCGKWFTFHLNDRVVTDVIERNDILGKPDLVYLAFDIETTKFPLKFPDSKIDEVMMISMCYEGVAVLITNRQIVGQDVETFQYAPKPEFHVEVEVYNEKDERGCLMKFFDIIFQLQPTVISSFNGDRFDWPFIEDRCVELGIQLEEQLGLRRQDENQEYWGGYISHMDCFAWVERDAYLPQGSHGLKAVTRSKLGYEPVEVDPELMVPLAKSNSQVMAEYSVSDAVATYFLYQKHVHDFIYALCTIIPLHPDEVLRKGSGTLCECLLMAQAYRRQIIFPNKKKELAEKFFQGHLLDSETYIGGKVECLRSGVYRNDFEQEFHPEPETLSSLWDGCEKLVKFVGLIENQEFDECEIVRVVSEIREKLQQMQDRGRQFKEKPLIYHLDVAAMYPNIILTNRLQPVSIVDNRICSGCIFNSSENRCQRSLEWQWKGDYFPLQRNEYEQIKLNCEYEMSTKEKKFNELPQDQQQKLLKQRVKQYCQKTYKTSHLHVVQLRSDMVCMRENDFYVSTVRDFRDRRYEFKQLVKVWKGKMDEAKKENGDVKECKDRIALYDSLQLAHKIILNSFYGYVMRKGARWYSMQMAAMVTHIGSNIISTAKKLVDKVGLTLELDTDGIWCMLPNGFPEDFSLKCKSGKKLSFSYPCYLLNELIYEEYKNSQYQWLVKDYQYGIRDEMSIFFEVDGPYRCMMLPAAREENKQLKKRYVVYNLNGSIAELKGFELKRRGELKIIKIFQQEIFQNFLKGQSLKECYEECGKVVKRWLNMLISHGEGFDDKELIEYIGECKVLSRDLNEYGQQKGVAITAAKRLMMFLGCDQVKGPGLNCFYIISKKPLNTPVTERAIPISIFEAESQIRHGFLRKWLKDGGLKEEDLEMKQIIDWDYYIERFGNTAQKIIIIPAILQKIENPVHEIQPPDWLLKKLREQNSGLNQTKINRFFSVKSNEGIQMQHLKHQMEMENVNNNINNNNNNNMSKVVVSENNPYDMNSQFKQWLNSQKSIWKSLKINKKQITRKGDLRQHFSLQNEQLLKGVWQILQIYQIDNGLFGLWVILDNNIVSNIQLKMQRKFYVNSYKKEVNQQFVKKILPREQKQHFLYEINIDDKLYFNEYRSFDHFLSNPDIQNIYEQDIPLLFRFITEIGAMCKIAKIQNKQLLQQYNHNSNNTKLFLFEQLTPVYEINNQSYLYNQQSTLLQSFIAIQQIQISKSNSIWTFFSLNEFIFIIVSQNKNVDSYKPIVRESLQAINISQPRIKIVSFQDNQQAALYITNYFDTNKSNKQFLQQKIAILQTTLDYKYLQSLGLKIDYPVLQLSKLSPSLLSLTAIDWQSKTLRYLITTYSSIPHNLDKLIQLSRYASIPLCNITLNSDQLLTSESAYFNYITDILYQRTLKHVFNALSWYGSKTIHENNDLIPTDFTTSEFISPGIYLNYTVEINIFHLSLNTIALSDELKDFDREATLLVSDDNTLDEFVAAKTAFRGLKILVLGWLDDVYNKQDKISDQLLQNISAWVYGQNSPLYEPYLGRILTRLNKKVFNYFISKLKSLGAVIVYASLQKVIISTQKQTFESAQSYTKYILETMIAQPLFKYLSLKPTQYYQLLLFKDQYNYIAYDEEPRCKLLLADYLPLKMQNLFKGFLFEYMIRTIEFRNQQDLSDLQGIQNLENSLKDFQLQYVKDKLSNRLYMAVDYLKECQNKVYDEQKTQEIKGAMQVEENRFQEEDYEQDSFVVSNNDLDDEEEEKIDQFKMSDWMIPTKIGKRFEINQENVNLILVNFICKMLSVDDNVEWEIRKIKGNCCRMLQISEFDKAAQFQEPTLKLVLNDMVCEACFNVSDLNIFQDEWLCQNCGDDLQGLEKHLCDFIEKWILFYQIQDLYCQNCKQAAVDPMKLKCYCSGNFHLRLDQFPDEFMLKFDEFQKSLMQLAEDKQFAQLKELLQSII